jgi:hypothetical protein
MQTGHAGLGSPLNTYVVRWSNAGVWEEVRVNGGQSFARGHVAHSKWTGRQSWSGARELGETDFDQ